MQDDSVCKGCMETVRISDQEIEQIFGKTLKVKNIKLVTESEYLVRMNICLKCPGLEYGTTCRYCGCLVKIKVKLEGAKCPYPYNPKW